MRERVESAVAHYMLSRACRTPSLTSWTIWTRAISCPPLAAISPASHRSPGSCASVASCGICERVVRHSTLLYRVFAECTATQPWTQRSIVSGIAYSRAFSLTLRIANISTKPRTRPPAPGRGAGRDRRAADPTIRQPATDIVCWPRHSIESVLYPVSLVRSRYFVRWCWWVGD